MLLKTNTMYVPDELLEDNKSSVITMNKDDYASLVNGLSFESNVKFGSSAHVHFLDDKALKIYYANPRLFSQSGSLLLNKEDVVKNVFNLLKLNHNDVSTPDKVYVVDGILKAYESSKITLPNISDINTKTEILIDDLINAWIKAYDISEYFSNQNILMYDLNEKNTFLKGSSFKICDLDFYTKELYNKYVFQNNYNMVNILFINFIEKYLFDYNVTITEDRYLIDTRNYVDYTFDELQLLSGYYDCETLLQIGKYI